MGHSPSLQATINKGLPKNAALTVPLYTFNTSDFNMDRYRNSPESVNLGFSPFWDNENNYFRHQTWGDALWNGVKQLGVLAKDSFLNHFEQYGRDVDFLRSGRFDQLFFDENALEQEERRQKLMDKYPIFQPSEGEVGWTKYMPFGRGSSAFYGNLLGNLGYIVGTVGAVVAENAALAFLTEGAGNIALAGKTVNSVYRALNALVSGTATVENLAGSVRKAKAIYGFLGKAGQVSGEVLKRAASFYRLYHASASEAALEATMGFVQQRKDLIDAYREMYGKDPDGEDLEEIEENAKQLGLTRFGENLALLSASNFIQFRNLFQPFTPARVAPSEISNRLTLEAAQGRVRDISARNATKTLGRDWVQKSADAVVKFQGFLAEGAEELAQSIIDKHTTELYTDIYKGGRGEWVDSLITGVKENLNREGFENFLSGALIGGISSFGKKFLPRERQRRQMRDEELAKAVAKLNSINVHDFGMPLKQYLAFQVAQAQRMANANIAGDVYEFQNAKDDLFREFVINHIKYGKFDAAIDRLNDLKTLGDRNFYDTFGIDDTVDNRKTVSDYVDGLVAKANEIKKAYAALDNKYRNPFDPSWFRRDSDEYMKEKLLYDAFEATKDFILRFSDKAKRAQDRQDSIYDEIEQRYGVLYGSIHRTYFENILDDNLRRKNIELLEKQVDEYSEGDLVKELNALKTFEEWRNFTVNPGSTVDTLQQADTKKQAALQAVREYLVLKSSGNSGLLQVFQQKNRPFTLDAIIKGIEDLDRKIEDLVKLYDDKNAYLNLSSYLEFKPVFDSLQSKIFDQYQRAGWTTQQQQQQATPVQQQSTQQQTTQQQATPVQQQSTQQQTTQQQATPVQSQRTWAPKHIPGWTTPQQQQQATPVQSQSEQRIDGLGRTVNVISRNDDGTADVEIYHPDGTIERKNISQVDLDLMPKQTTKGPVTVETVYGTTENVNITGETDDVLETEEGIDIPKSDVTSVTPAPPKSSEQIGQELRKKFNDLPDNAPTSTVKRVIGQILNTQITQLNKEDQKELFYDVLRASKIKFENNPEVQKFVDEYYANNVSRYPITDFVYSEGRVQFFGVDPVNDDVVKEGDRKQEFTVVLGENKLDKDLYNVLTGVNEYSIFSTPEDIFIRNNVTGKNRKFTNNELYELNPHVYKDNDFFINISEDEFNSPDFIRASRLPYTTKRGRLLSFLTTPVQELRVKVSRGLSGLNNARLAEKNRREVFLTRDQQYQAQRGIWQIGYSRIYDGDITVHRPGKEEGLTSKDFLDHVGLTTWVMARVNPKTLTIEVLPLFDPKTEKKLGKEFEEVIADQIKISGKGITSEQFKKLREKYERDVAFRKRMMDLFDHRRDKNKTTSVVFDSVDLSEIGAHVEKKKYRGVEDLYIVYDENSIFNKPLARKVTITRETANSASKAAQDQQTVSSPAPTTTTPPANLQKASTRIKLKGKVYTPEFDSVIDKAAFIATLPNRGERKKEFVEFIKKETGMTDEQVQEYGKQIRQRVKEIANKSDADAIKVAPVIPIQNILQTNAGTTTTETTTETPSGNEPGGTTTPQENTGVEVRFSYKTITKEDSKVSKKVDLKAVQAPATPVTTKPVVRKTVKLMIDGRDIPTENREEIFKIAKEAFPERLKNVDMNDFINTSGFRSDTGKFYYLGNDKYLNIGQTIGVNRDLILVPKSSIENKSEEIKNSCN